MLVLRDGTTDITRTVHWGTPTTLQKVTFLLKEVIFIILLKVWRTPRWCIWKIHLVFCSQEAFTRVLMGNIEISRTIFPSGTRGERNIISLKRVLVSPLESPLPPHVCWWSTCLCSRMFEGCFFNPPGVNMEMLGRRALWEVGLNYGHGTGHGVGNYFGVHECEAVCSEGFWCKAMIQKNNL